MPDPVPWLIGLAMLALIAFLYWADRRNPGSAPTTSPTAPGASTVTATSAPTLAAPSIPTNAALSASANSGAKCDT